MSLIPSRVAAYAVLLTSLTGVVQAAVFPRQAQIPTDLPLEPTDTGTTPTASATRSTVTTIIILSQTPTSGPFTLSSATATFIPTISIPRGVPTPSAPSVTEPVDHNSSSENRGAIAGGVIGGLAVIVAAFCAFVWFRRRSSKHWRNRAAGRWQSFDSKDAGGPHARSIYVGEPVNRAHGDTKQADPEPLPPLYIRDRHSTAGAPFGDVPGSPTSPRNHSRVGSISTVSHQHHRRGSSFGGFDVELQPTGGTPR